MGDVYDSYSKKLLEEEIYALDLEEDTKETASTGVKNIRRIFGDTCSETTTTTVCTNSSNNSNNSNRSSFSSTGGNNTTTTISTSVSTTTNNNGSLNRSRRPESPKNVEEEEPEIVENVTEFDAVINHTRRQHLPGQKEWLDLRGDRRIITDEEAHDLVRQFATRRPNGCRSTPRILVRVDKYGNCRFAKPEDIRKNVNTKRSSTYPPTAPVPSTSTAVVSIPNVAPKQQEKKKKNEKKLTTIDTNTIINDSDHSQSSKKRKVSPPASTSSSGGKHSKKLPPVKPTLTLRAILSGYYEMLNTLEKEHDTSGATGLPNHHAQDFRKTLDAFLSVPYTDQLPESLLGLALQGYYHIKQTTMALWDELYRLYTGLGGKRYSLTSSGGSPPRGPFGGNGSSSSGGRDAADPSGSGKGGFGGGGFGSPFSSSSLGTHGNSNGGSHQNGRGGATGGRHSDNAPPSNKENQHSNPGECAMDDGGDEDDDDDDDFGAGGAAVVVAPPVKPENMKAIIPVVVLPKGPKPQCTTNVETGNAQEKKPGKRASTGMLTGDTVSTVAQEPKACNNNTKPAFRSSTSWNDGSRNTKSKELGPPMSPKETSKSPDCDQGDKVAMNAPPRLRDPREVGKGGDRTETVIFSSRSGSSISGKSKPQHDETIEKPEDSRAGASPKRDLPSDVNDSKVRVLCTTPSSAKASPVKEDPKKTLRPWKSWQQGQNKDGFLTLPLRSETDNLNDGSDASVLPVFRALAEKLALTKSGDAEETILPIQELQDAYMKHEPEQHDEDPEAVNKDESNTGVSDNQTTILFKEKILVINNDETRQKDSDLCNETNSRRHELKPTSPRRRRGMRVRFQQSFPPPYRARFTSSERDKTREKKIADVESHIDHKKHDWVQPSGWKAMTKPRELNSSVDPSKSLIRLW